MNPIGPSVKRRENCRFLAAAGSGSDNFALDRHTCACSVRRVRRASQESNMPKAV